MKNLVKYGMLLLLAVFTFSCEEENPEIFTGETAVYFSEGTYGSIQIFEAGALIQDGVTVTLIGGAQSSDVTIGFSVDPASTAAAGVHYNFLTSGNSVSIPAGEFSATIPFEVIIDGFTGPEDVRTLIINIDSSSAAVSATENSVTATLGYVCPSELLGPVDFAITNASGLGNIASLVGNTGVLEWTGGNIGANGTEYGWSTFTFGAYQLLYGCCEREGGNDANLFVNDFCDDISFSGSDAFGCIWELSVVSVSGPVLTVDVFSDCMGTLRVEMTRQDGNDWPSLS